MSMILLTTRARIILCTYSPFASLWSMLATAFTPNCNLCPIILLYFTIPITEYNCLFVKLSHFCQIIVLSGPGSYQQNLNFKTVMKSIWIRAAILGTLGTMYKRSNSAVLFPFRSNQRIAQFSQPYNFGLRIFINISKIYFNEKCFGWFESRAIGT